MFKVVCVSWYSLKFISVNRRLWLIFITFLVAVVFRVAKPKGKYFGCDFQSRFRARISASKWKQILKTKPTNFNCDLHLKFTPKQKWLPSNDIQMWNEGPLKSAYNCTSRSIKVQNLLFNPFKQTWKIVDVKVSNCCKISAAFYDEKSRNQTCISNQQRVRVKSAIPLMSFLLVFSAEATTNDYVRRCVPFCCF